MRAMGRRSSRGAGSFPQVSGSADYTRTLRSQFSGIDFGRRRRQRAGDEQPALRAAEPVQPWAHPPQLIFDGGQTPARNRAPQARRRSRGDRRHGGAGADPARRHQRLLRRPALRPAGEIASRRSPRPRRCCGRRRSLQDVGAQSEFELLRARVARDNQMPVVLEPQPAPGARLLAPEAAPEHAARRRGPPDDRRRGPAGALRRLSDLAPAERAGAGAPGGGERGSHRALLTARAASGCRRSRSPRATRRSPTRRAASRLPRLPRGLDGGV